MGTKYKSDQAAVPGAGVTLSKLYNDPSFTQYDVFAFDALDPLSWAKQAVPVSGDQLIDISPADGADATFNTPPAWNGGFQYSGNQSCTLPASCNPATTSRGNIAMAWLHIAATNNFANVIGWGKAGPISMNWGLYNGNPGSGLQVIVFGDGTSSTTTLPAAGLYLFAMGRCEDGAGGFLSRRKVLRASDSSITKNDSSASGANAMQPSGSPQTRIGMNDTFGGGAVFRCFRFRMVDVAANAGVATAAWWDAVVDAEFAANKGRTDWVLT